MSQLALDLIEKEKIEKTGILDLKNCGLTEIPDEVFELVWLLYLDCSSSINPQSNKISKIPKKINNLTELLYLNLGNEISKYFRYRKGNEIEDVSPLKNLKNLRTLILKGTSIQDISHLNNLKNLKHLDISDLKNQGKQFLSSLKNLKDLEVLKQTWVDNFDFSIFKKLKTIHITNWNCYNYVEDLSIIGKLQNLEDLLINYINQGFSDEDYSKHAKEYRYKGKIKDLNFLKDLTQLKRLTLTNHLIEDTEILNNFPQLEILDLSENRIRNTNGLKELIHLKKLKLNSCGIRSIDFISKLQSLQRLELNNNHINELSAIKEILNLKFLEIEKNNITDISIAENFKKLVLLKAGNNNIVRIEGLKDLIRLKNLDLENNQIVDITAITNLTEIRILDLSNNQIIDISSLSNLDEIFKLNLNQNNIKNIDSLKILTQLWKLNLSHNSIVNIDSLENLNGLVFLHLNNNKIRKIEAIKDLHELYKLDLSYNEISDVSALNLEKARDVDLSNNQLKRISLNFFNKHPKITILHLRNNPIENIPREIFDRGRILAWEDVKIYLEDIEHGKSKINDYKVILIGNGSVGKTQIAKRLSEGEQFKFNEEHDSTHAIVLLKSKIKDINLNIWDFAGQDIYHATHRLFMKTRALFLLVWDFENEHERIHHIYKNKQYKNEKLDYWLEYANHYSSDNPIIIVQNKIDDYKELYKFAPDTIKKLQDTYTQISIYKGGFIDVSAKNNIGFSKLKTALERLIKKNSLFSKSQYLPDSWVKVRDKLEELREQGRKTLSYEEYETISHDIKKSRSTVIEYLHDIGEVYYQRGHFNNEIILNQSWAIEAIYKILDRESEYFEIFEGNGKLDYDDLTELWSEYIDRDKELLIKFMLDTELCFETSDYSEDPFLELKDRTFSIPQFLSEEKSSRISLEERFIDKVEYSFLPAVFIYRFISRASRVFKNTIPWKHGIYIKEGNDKAIVEAIYKEQVIIIKANNKTLVKIIKKELDVIINSSHITIPFSEYDDSEEEEYIKRLKKQRRGLKKYNNEVVKKSLNYRESDVIDFFKEMEQRFYDKIENKTNEIINNSNENKIEIIEQINEGFQKMVLKFDEIRQDLKTNKIEIEDAILMLLVEIDKIRLTDYKQFKNELHSWLPNAHELYTGGEYYLIQAEFLYYITDKTEGNDDYSASILQYCRAIENEFKKLFLEYKDIERSDEIKKIIDKDNSHKKFSNYLSKSGSLGFGDMIIILESLNHKMVKDENNNYPLFIDFGEFIEQKFDILILLKEDYSLFITDFKQLIDEYYDDITKRNNHDTIRHWADKDCYNPYFSNFIKNKTPFKFIKILKMLNTFNEHKKNKKNSDKFKLFNDFCEFLSRKGITIEKEDSLLKMIKDLTKYRNDVAHPNDKQFDFDKEFMDNVFIPKVRFVLKAWCAAKKV